MPLGADCLDDSGQRHSMFVCILAHGFTLRVSARPSAPQRYGPVRIAELHPADLRCHQSLLGAPGDRLALLLGDEGHDADRQVIGLRYVARYKADACVPKRQQEGLVPAQPIQLGDHQRRQGDPGELQSLPQFRPVVLAPAFNLGEPAEDRGGQRLCVILNRLLLRLKPQPRLPLPGRRDPLVGHKLRIRGSIPDRVYTCATFVSLTSTRIDFEFERSKTAIKPEGN